MTRHLSNGKIETKDRRGREGGMAIFSELKITDFPGLCVASLSWSWCRVLQLTPLWGDYYLQWFLSSQIMKISLPNKKGQFGNCCLYSTIFLNWPPPGGYWKSMKLMCETFDLYCKHRVKKTVLLSIWPCPSRDNPVKNGAYCRMPEGRGLHQTARPPEPRRDTVC